MALYTSTFTLSYLYTDRQTVINSVINGANTRVSQSFGGNFLPSCPPPLQTPQPVDDISATFPVYRTTLRDVFTPVRHVVRRVILCCDWLCGVCLSVCLSVVKYK